MNRAVLGLEKATPVSGPAGKGLFYRLRIALLCAALVMVGCFHLPEWETEVTIPIMSRRFYAAEMLDSTFFRVRPDSALELFYDFRLDTIRLNDEIGSFDIDGLVDTRVSDFVFPPIAGPPSGTALATILDLPVPDSIYMNVPGFSFELPLAFPLPGFERAEVHSGILLLDVYNSTDVPLDTIRLHLPGLPPADFGPVGPRSSLSTSYPLDQLVVDSMFTVGLGFVSTGTSGESVWVRAGDSLLIGLTVDSLRLARGRIRVVAPVSAATSSISHLETRSGIRVDSTLVDSGTLEFSFSNSLPIRLSARLVIPEFRFDSVFAIAPEFDTTIALDLAHRGYRNADQDSSRLSIFAFVTALPDDRPVELDSTQGMSVSLNGQVLTVTYVTAFAHDTTWSRTQEITVVSDSPEELARMRFAHVWLGCSAASTIDFTGIMDLTAVAYNQSGDSALVHALIPLAAGRPELPVQSSMPIDLAPLFDIGPDRLVVYARAGVIGPGQAWSGSFVAGEMSTAVPLRFALVAGALDFGPWTVAVNPKKMRGLIDDVTGGNVFVRVVNHLPFALTGELSAIARDSTSVVATLAAPQPRLAPGTGIVVEPRDSIIETALSLEQTRVFANTFETRLRIHLPATDTVTLMAWDYFEIEYSYVVLIIGLKP